jgi:hypothetical protein
MLSGVSESAPITVVETPEFLSATRKLMTDEERGVLIAYLAHNPTAGVLIKETGGVRKLRWGLEGRGSAVERASSTFFTAPTYRFLR